MQRIAYTVHDSWGSFSNLINAAKSDYLKLRAIIQSPHKKGFPYLSGLKIFNYLGYFIF